MTLLDRLKGKKENIPPMQTESIEKVEEPMDINQKIQQSRQQGLSPNQIVQSLQRDGHDSAEILEAMNNVDQHGAGPVPPPQGMQPDQGPSPSQMQMPPPGPPMPPGGPPMPPGMNPGASSTHSEMDRHKIEELAEVIIDEKWEELIKSLNKITEWKDATETRLAQVEQRMGDLKSDFDNLHKAIIGKIGEYDQNILNVGTEIKAMEQVFQKILPTFTENVAELSRITKRAGSSTKKK